MWVQKYNSTKKVRGKEKKVIKYQFFERFKDPLTGKYRKVSVSYEKNTAQVRKQAQGLLEERIDSKLRETTSKDTKITIGELQERFKPYYKNKVAIKTSTSYLGQLKQACNDLGLNTQARQLTTQAFNRYFDKILYSPEKKLSNNTVRNRRKILLQMYKYAVRFGYLESNPVGESEINYKNDVDAKRDRIQNKYLTKDEYDKILDFCSEKKSRRIYRDAFELQYLTGMRFGELSALQVCDIKKRDGHVYLDINGTLVLLSNPARAVKEDRPKTLAGIRQIVLSPKAEDIVEQYAKNKKGDDWLISYHPTPAWPNGRPVRLNSANRILKHACEKYGIKKRVTTHFFRHTHVSNLADLGIPLRVIQKRVGHADGEITRRIYLHVTKKAENDFVNKVSEIDKI